MEWLGMQQGKVTKDAVLAYLGGSGVQVQEVTLAEPYKTGELDTCCSGPRVTPRTTRRGRHLGRRRAVERDPRNKRQPRAEGDAEVVR